MLIRVRSNVGIWRVEGLDALTATVSDVLEGIAIHRPQVVYTQPLSLDPACQRHLNATQTLTEQGLQHGDLIHCRVDPETCADVTVTAVAADTSNGMETDEEGKHHAPSPEKSRNMKRVIDKDGKIKLVPTSDQPGSENDRGFRKGMMALRDIKMHWTLNDFIALDSQYEFKMKRQESAICQQVSLNVPAVSDFQAYLQKFQFQRKRFGYLYGTFVTDETKDDEKDEQKENQPNKVRVEAIYEPPQENDPEAAEGFVPLDDPNETVVEEIATMLGWKRVGWILGHESREKGFVLSSAEVIMAAELQLEAAGGVNETPFCTIVVSPAPDGTVSVEAFQVSQQCMAMVAEQALEIGPDPKICVVNETFTAIQEGKPSPTVDNNFFLAVVPIVQHTSDRFVADFPRINRDVDDRTPSHDELKRTLQKAGSAGWTFVDRLADFQLLIYLAQFLDVHADLPKICAAIVNPQEQPLDDGYKLIIKSMAGLEGSY